MPDLHRTSFLLSAPQARYQPPRTAVAVLVAGLLCGLPHSVRAQASDWDAPTTLRASPMLGETIPEAVRSQLPVFVSGDRITGQPDIRAEIEGNAMLRRGDTVIRAQRMEYTARRHRPRHRAGAHQPRRQCVRRHGAELRVNAFEGFFTDARYQFLRNGAHGDATRGFHRPRPCRCAQCHLHHLCTREEGQSWQPDWVLRADRIHIDQAEEVGTADHAVLEFRVPLLPIPSISFPLSDKRKSGLLPPTLGLNSVNGFEYAQPYYWNIAPNRDATLQAAIMAAGRSTGRRVPLP